MIGFFDLGSFLGIRDEAKVGELIGSRWVGLAGDDQFKNDATALMASFVNSFSKFSVLIE